MTMPKIVCAKRKNYLHHEEKKFCTRTKIFFYAYKKMPFFHRLYADDDTKECKDSKLPKKVALCHIKVSTKVSFSQKHELMEKRSFTEQKPKYS